MPGKADMSESDSSLYACTFQSFSIIYTDEIALGISAVNRQTGGRRSARRTAQWKDVVHLMHGFIGPSLPRLKQAKPCSTMQQSLPRRMK